MAKEGFNFDEIERRLRAGKMQLMVDLEAVSTKFFLDSFRKQGWDDGALHRWQEVKRRIPGTKAFKSARPSSRTRSILVQSGRLRRGFYTRIRRMDIIQIANSTPYAQVHNEGAKGTAYVKPHSRYVKSGEYAGTGVFNIKTRREKKVQLEARQNVKGYSRKVNIPQRQFMGHSQSLQNKQINVIKHWVNKVLDLE